MAEITIETFFWAIAGSFLPALFWLWFWLKQDSKKPEPVLLLSLSFITGAVTVFLVYPIESFAYKFTSGTSLFVAVALIEEIMKYLALYLVALRSKYFDEPIDAVIYAITIALGFSAMENLLYLVSTISQDGVMLGVINSNLRFVGATLLHTVSSAAIGVAVALSFYKRPAMKTIYLALGLITAFVLHTIFNLTIINTESIGEILIVFFYLWIAIVILLLLFEKIKKIRPVVFPRIRKFKK